MVVLSTIATKVLSLIYLIFVARYLGDTGFGQYSFVFALLSFFVVFTAFGMDALIIREVAKDKSKSSAFLINSSVLKTLLCLSSWAVLLVLAFFLNKPPEIKIGIMIIGFCLLPDSLVKTAKAVFSGHEKMEYNTFIEVIYRLAIVAVGIFFIKYDYGIVGLFSVPLFASFGVFILTIFLYVKKIGGIELSFDIGLLRYLLKTSYAFALTGVFVAIYHRIDAVMLSFMKGDAPVGWYSAAYGLTESLLFIPAALVSAAFPVLSRFFNESKDDFQRAYRKLFQFLLLFALPIAIGITILAEPIVSLIYKAEFSNAVPALRALVWATAFMFLNTVMSSTLYAANRQKTVAGLTAILVAVNILLNLILIPRYSHVGASWATVMTEMVGFGYCYWFIAQHLCKNNVRVLFLKALLSSFVMALFLLMATLNLFLLIGLGALLYLAALVALKAFTKEDRDFMRRLFSF